MFTCVKNSIKIFLLSIAILGSKISLADNLKTGFKQLTTGAYQEAILSFNKELQKSPENVAANFGMAKIFSAKDFKGYSLDSAFFYSNRATQKLPLNPTDKSTKKYLEFGVRDFTIKEQNSRIQNDAFAIAEKTNTVEQFTHFAATFSDTNLVKQATQKRNALAFEIAKKQNSYEAMKKFAETYPLATEKAQALQLYEQLLYQQITADGKPESYKKYMEQYPKGAYFEEALSEFEQRGLENTLKENTLDAYVKFQKSYPHHPAIGRVQDSIYVLYTRDGFAALYKDFLRLYPTNRNTETAWRELYLLETVHATPIEYENFSKNFPNYPFKNEITKDSSLSTLALAPQQNGDKFGYVNTATKQEVISARYYEANDFSCGLAAVTQEDCDGKCTYYYINKNGDTAFAATFNYAADFVEGRAVVGIGDCSEDACKYGVIDKRGKFIVPAIYNEIDDLSERFYAAEINDKYGFLDSRGRVVIPFIYNDALGFKENTAAVKTDSGWTYIDTNGIRLTPKVFSNTASFANGLCAATQNDSTWGYINHNFNWAILPAYAEADDFENGFATVAKRERTKKNIYEYQRYKIDSTGKIIEKLLAKPTKKNKRKRR